jgi:hypothetical protein
MNGWGAIQYVGSGLSLVAFIVAAILYAYRAHLRHQAEIIKSAPEKDRLEAIATAAEFFRVDVSKLEPAQQAQIVVTEIEARTRRDLLRAGIAAIVAVLLAIVAIVAMYSPVPDHPNQADTTAWGQEVGGSGGFPFGPLTCRSGEALVGLYGKDKDTGAGSGPFIFSIGPICAPVRFEGIINPRPITLGIPSRGDEVGSDQGVPFELRCPPKTVVVGSELASSAISVIDQLGNTSVGTFLIDHLTLRCSGALHIANHGLVSNVSRPGTQISSFKTHNPFLCPDGNAAIGIKGRAGQWIDALSIGCGHV